MPGIVGFVTEPIADKQAQATIKEMQDLITHHDFYRQDDLFNDGWVYATRSHTDIIQKQPQPYYECGIYVWLDGEFYNQDQLAKHLDSTTDYTDPALLTALFKHYRDFSFLRHVDGIYSAVIYDSVRQQVHLITDRYGLQHLYWTIHQGSLAWGSEAKAMLALPGFTPKINAQTLDDFFAMGYLCENRTWFEGVDVLSSGTVFTWDIRERSDHVERYWYWDQIKPITGAIEEGEITEELARRFIASVERRCQGSERISLTLSGGLDSRAILASLPKLEHPAHAITFGKAGCDDIRIAAMVAKLKSVHHHAFEISADNWLTSRINGVWWTDGQKNLMHMHGIEGLTLMKGFADVNLDGFFGDVGIGGAYLNRNRLSANDAKFSEIELIGNRARRFVFLGPKFEGVYLKARHPFCANDLLELAMSLPEDMRKNSYIYNKMLLKAFPEFFATIPYQNTGVPISWAPQKAKILRFPKRVKNKLRKEATRLIGNTYDDPYNYTDYQKWLRHEPAKSFFKKVLTNASAIYPEYIAREQVLTDVEKHLGGENHADDVCRYVTFEIWLQQVFEGRYRSGCE
ncbi:MAG: asparagine synthase-related protein [Candidatus Aquicultor sp.]